MPLPAFQNTSHQRSCRSIRCNVCARISHGTCGAAFSKRPNVPVTCPRKTACQDAEVYVSTSTQLIRRTRPTCPNFGANMKEKHPDQHVHGHRSLHTQAMTRLFLLDFGNPRPGQDLDRRAEFGVEILDWHVRYGSRKKPCGLLANRRRQAPCAAANGAAAQSEWLGHCTASSESFERRRLI